MKQIDVQTFLDEAPFSWFHAKLLCWCFVIIVIDGYDIAITGTALPSIMKALGVNATTAGIMASSALFGMMLGAIVLGALADRIGRRYAISISVLLFSVFTAAAGLATEPWSFSAARFFAGLGIGGVMPNIVAQMTEYSPRRLRSFLTTVMFSGYAVGGILAALIGKHFIESYGWKVVFFAAGAPLVLIPFILGWMPEAPSFLLAKGGAARLRNILSLLGPTYPLEEQLLGGAQPPIKTGRIRPAMLFQEGRGISTIMFWIAFFTGLFMIYALSTWLTKLMALAGYSLGSALSLVIALNVCAVFGAVVGGWFADRFHIKWVLVVMYLFGSLFLYAMTWPLSAEWLYILIGAVGGCTTGSQIVAYAYCGQFYPAAVRSTGIGMASGVGRTGAITAPLIIGTIISWNLPLEQNFMVISAAGLVGAVALACINHRHSASRSSSIEEAVKLHKAAQG